MPSKRKLPPSSRRYDHSKEEGYKVAGFVEVRIDFDLLSSNYKVADELRT